jgi:GNAT superfamily N-acetyltransferase
VVVRDVRHEDVGGIGKAHAEAWRVGYRGLFAPDQLQQAVQRRRDMWISGAAGQLPGATLLVVEDGGVVVGFVHFGPASVSDEMGEIYGLYVHPDSWGSGSAQALMDRAIVGLGDSYDQAILWTHQGAGRARRFYAKSGWIETGSEQTTTLWDGVAYPAVEYGRDLTST